jgi:multidrug efflux pump subunit AcrB
LGDVASVAKSFRQPRRSLTVASGYPAVAIGVLARNDKRIDVWNADAMKVVNAFREEMPSDILVQELFVQDAYVTERLRSLQMNLLLGASAVVVVIGVLMGWRNALVVGLTLPLAAWMVLAGLQVLRIPLHQMSVTGLILALGLLIDNAIVVVDEVTVRMREGNSPADAVAASSRHLAVPLFGSTLTTALAFAPIALMPGPAGEFVGSIAISVILAIFSSFLLAMTVVPTVAAMVAGRAHDRNDPRETQEKTWSMLRDGFRSQALAENYRRVLVWLFSHPKTAITLSIILPFVGFLQARTLPLQFFPPADRDQLQIELEMPSHASLQETHRLADQVRQRLRRYPEIQEVHWFIGESAPMFYYNLVGRRKDTAHYAQALVQLTEVSSDTSLIHQLQRDLDRAFPGARLLVRQLEQGPPFDAPLELRLLGPDLERLEELASEIRSVLAQTPGVIHTRTESASTLPNVSVRVDETAARLAGLDHRVIAQQLESTLEGSLGGLVLETTEDLPVRIRLPNAARNDLAQIGSLDLLPNTAVGDGTFAGIPLAAVTSFQVVPERAAIERLDGVRMSEVQAFIPAGTLPAVVQRQFETRWNASGTRLPAGYTLKFAGEAAERNEAVGNLLGNVGLLAVMMVATLVLSFGSFRLSAIIGGVALLSVGLGLGSLWLYGSPFGFMAIVGTMGLIGVAINDAIVVLAALRENREAAMGDVSATVEVVLRATRHVVATSVTTLAGFTPLVLAGGGFWPPLAITIASGVSGATLLALVFVPAVHRLGVGAAPSGVWQRWTKRDTVTKIPTTATAVA